MISFGQQLYRLTSRDLETLQVEPFFRTVAGTIVSNAPAGSVEFRLPLDRALYVHSLIWNGGLRSGSSYSAIRASFSDGGNFVQGQIFEQEFDTLLTTFAQTRVLELLVPPQSGKIQLTFLNAAVPATATITGTICGYLIPPGAIGRA